MKFAEYKFTAAGFVNLNNRRKKKDGIKKTGSGLFTVFVTAAVLILAGSTGLFKGAGEGIAMLSAMLVMPDSGAELLQERFRSEIYGDDGLPDTVPEQGQPVWPQPLPEIPSEPKAGASQPEQPEEQREEKSRTAPKIPTKYAAPIVEENFAGREGSTLIQYRNGFIKNDTKQPEEAVNEVLEKPWSARFQDLSKPQVLIVHTHATESYEPYDRELYDTRNTWRSTDNANNMVAVGDAMRQVLEENGIGVIHDTTQHDYPSYNGSYERSAETIRSYLEEYPDIKIVLDLHRDAMQREDAIIKPVAMVDGKKAAQIMIIAACDDGAMNIPNWRENLRFAAAFQDYMEQYYPELTKPVFFCCRKYNMDLTTGSLLLEFGSNANTLDEALYSAQMAGQALSNLLHDLQEESDLGVT